MSILDIYYTLDKILRNKFKDAEPQFKKGFEVALGLLEIGIEKRLDFNLSIKNRELERENKQLRKVLTKRYKKLKDFESDLQGISLITGIPLEYFREILIETPIGNFSMVVNMDEHTLNACIINFAVKKTFSTLNEGKSKLMEFINVKKELGFKAYKDKEVAIKEGVKIL